MSPAWHCPGYETTPSAASSILPRSLLPQLRSCGSADTQAATRWPDSHCECCCWRLPWVRAAAFAPIALTNADAPDRASAARLSRVGGRAVGCRFNNTLSPADRPVPPPEQVPWLASAAARGSGGVQALKSSRLPMPPASRRRLLAGESGVPSIKQNAVHPPSCDPGGRTPIRAALSEGLLHAHRAPPHLLPLPRRRPLPQQHPCGRHPRHRQQDSHLQPPVYWRDFLRDWLDGACAGRRAYASVLSRQLLRYARSALAPCSNLFKPYCTPCLQRAMFPQIKFPGEVPAAAGLGWTQVRVPWLAWGVARVA